MAQCFANDREMTHTDTLAGGRLGYVAIRRQLESTRTTDRQPDRWNDWLTD